MSHEESANRHRLLTVARACEVVRVIQAAGKPLSLSEVVARTGLERTIAFRILHTLEEENFLRKSEKKHYVANVRIQDASRYRIGFACQARNSFAMAVGHGLRWSAADQRIDLVEVNNENSAKSAIRNAELLVRENVQLVVEFQTHQKIATKLSSIFADAQIPVIAVDIPQPGAVFLGIDNRKAGELAGKALVQGAKRAWKLPPEHLVLLDAEVSGSVPQIRITAAQLAVQKEFPTIKITRIDVKGLYLDAYQALRKHQSRLKGSRILITGVTDYCVLGALSAFEEAGRKEDCLAVGMGDSPESRNELTRPWTRLIGVVGFFPGEYGARIIRLATEILSGKLETPVVHIPPQMLTAQNLDHFYPRILSAQPIR